MRALMHETARLPSADRTLVSGRAPAPTVFAVLALLATAHAGCRLDASMKVRCRTVYDCNDGYTCRNQICERSGEGPGALDASPMSDSAALDASDAAPPSGTRMVQIIATGQAMPWRLFVAGPNLYWTNGDSGEIMSAPRDGSGPPTALFRGPIGPVGIAVDDEAVYWTNWLMGEIIKMPLTGGPAVTLASGQPRPENIVVDGQNAYWTSSNGAMVAAKAGGAAPVPLGHSSPSIAIAADTRRVYWTTLGQEIVAVPNQGHEPPTFLAGQQPNSWGIAVDSTDVFWTTYDNGTVGKVANDGTGVSTVIAFGLSQPGPLAIDDTHVYVCEHGRGTVIKLSKDGRERITIADGLTRPYAIAVDDVNVYWTTLGDDKVMKTRK
jgi:hypothetical protein